MGRHAGGSTLGNMNEDIPDIGAYDKAKKVHENKIITHVERPIYAKDYVELCEIIGQDAIGLCELAAPFFLKNSEGKEELAMDKSFAVRADVKERLVMATENMDYFKKILPFLDEYKKEAAAKNMGVTILCADLFTQLYENIFGLTNFSYLLYDDPLLIEELLNDGIEYWLGFSKYIANEGVDFIYFADDLAFKSGLFVKPEIFRKLYLEKYCKIMEPFASKGIPIIFHSEGDVSAIMDDLIDMGVQCFNPIDPYSMDYIQLEKRYGKKLTLMGNIDLTFPLSTGKPEDVREDIRKHMDICKPGYRYICATSHSMVNYIPDDNVTAFFDAIHEFGQY